MVTRKLSCLRVHHPFHLRRIQSNQLRNTKLRNRANFFLPSTSTYLFMRWPRSRPGQGQCVLCQPIARRWSRARLVNTPNSYLRAAVNTVRAQYSQLLYSGVLYVYVWYWDSTSTASNTRLPIVLGRSKLDLINSTAAASLEQWFVSVASGEWRLSRKTIPRTSKNLVQLAQLLLRPWDCCVRQLWPNITGTWRYLSFTVTIFCRHYRSVFNRRDVIGLQNLRIRWNNEK